MTSDLPDRIDIYHGIPDRPGKGLFVAGDSYLDDQGRLEVDLTIDDDAGERDVRCHEGDTFQFAGATWEITKISEAAAHGRRHVATLSRVE